MRPAVIATGLFLLAAIRTASAQCHLETFEESTGAVGRSCAIVTRFTGPFGAPLVWFLERERSGWRTTESATLGDFQGMVPCAVAIDGDRAIAGGPEATQGTHWYAGRAWTFERAGGQWIPTELVSPSIGQAHFFGTSVAIRSDVAVVGAPHRGPQGDGDGLARAHVFEFDGTSWSEVALLSNYGSAIAVDEDTIVLGDARAYPGQVHVYERIAGTWTSTAELTVPTLPEGPYFGSSVALEGDRLVVGAAIAVEEPGIVKVFERQSGVWQEVQSVFPLYRHDHDQFGTAVALDGATLLVGAPGSWDVDSGRVYRFEHDGTRFVERGAIGPSYQFGTSVSVHGEDAFLGDLYYAYLYRLGFEHVQAFCPTTPNSTGAHGALVAEGCDSVSGEEVWLVATGLPPSVTARCFFGGSSAQAPYGDGFRCVGNPLFRLPVGETNGAGAFATGIEFDEIPGSNLAAGRTWYFQALHRDHVGAGMNLTNALSVILTP